MSLEFKVFTAGLNKLDSMLAVYSRYLWERKCELYVQTGSWVTRQAEQKYLLAPGGKPSSPFRAVWGLFLLCPPYKLFKVKVKRKLQKELANYWMFKSKFGKWKKWRQVDFPIVMIIEGHPKGGGGPRGSYSACRHQNPQMHLRITCPVGVGVGGEENTMPLPCPCPKPSESYSPGCGAGDWMGDCYCTVLVFGAFSSLGVLRFCKVENLCCKVLSRAGG